MKLNQQKLLEKLSELWRNKECPICGHRNWGIDARIVTPIHVDENKTINIGGKINPLIPITCDKCGYTIFINALKIGVLDLDDGDDNG